MEAYLESIAPSGGNLVLNVVIVTATEKIPHQFTFNASATLENIKAQIKAYADSVVTSDTVAKSLQLGLLDLTPGAIDPQPKETEERNAFRAAYRTLQGIARAVDVGLIARDSQEYTAALEDARAAFKSDYIELL